jgi:hypothetical protein
VHASRGGVMSTSDSSFNITNGTFNLLTTVQLLVVVSWPHLIHHLILPTVLLLTTVQLLMVVSWAHLIHHLLLTAALLLTAVQVLNSGGVAWANIHNLTLLAAVFMLTKLTDMEE